MIISAMRLLRRPRQRRRQTLLLLLVQNHWQPPLSNPISEGVVTRDSRFVTFTDGNEVMGRDLDRLIPRRYALGLR